MWNPFRTRPGAPTPTAAVPAGVPAAVVPLTLTEAREAARTFGFRRLWICACGATLTIRAKEDRPEGPTNFRPYPPTHRSAGHTQVASTFLTWNGLAEERGWLSDPVRCPACRVGLSREAYRQARREGRL